MNTTSRVVVALSAGLFCFFAFRAYLPFPLVGVEASGVDTSMIADNYGLDRLEEDSELFDDHWLSEVEVGGKSSVAVAGHLLDTISFADWKRNARMISVNHNFGNTYTLYTA